MEEFLAFMGKRAASHSYVEAASTYDEVTFAPKAPTLRSPCWSDEELRVQATLSATNRISERLVIHTRTCSACRMKLTDYSMAYQETIRRTEAFYGKFFLLWLFAVFMTWEWYRARIFRKAFQR